MHRVTTPSLATELRHTAAPLRDWLQSRSASERTTVARLWGLPEAADNPAALADALLQPEAVAQMLAGLGPQPRAALERVQAEGGAIPAARLERDFGPVRTHGQYPNPRAYLLALERPASPAEHLYVMALIQRLDVRGRPFYTIPPDLLALLPPVPPRDRTLKLTTQPAPEHVWPGDPHKTEQMLLALQTLAQEGQLELIPSGALNKVSLVRLIRATDPEADVKGLSYEWQAPFQQFLRALSQAAGLARATAEGLLRPTREALEWMRLPAAERSHRLLNAWIESSWDELVSLCGLKSQQTFGRNLPETRRSILALLAQLPQDAWVALGDFAAAVKSVEPDYARPDGRYDAEQWDQIEGAQLRRAADTTMRWLGLTDLGGTEVWDRVRLTPLGAALLQGAPAPPEPPAEPLVVQPNFEVLVPAYAALEARFQIRRVAELVRSDTVTVYRLGERRLHQALEQGIGLEDVLRFLREQSGRELPQNVAATLADWAARYGQVTLRRGALLEARDPALLEQIRRDRRVKLPPAERLSEQALLLRAGDAADVAERLRKAGYGLQDDGAGPDQPLREQDLTVLFAALEFYARAGECLGLPGVASASLRKRVGGMLSEQQLNRAFQATHSAVQALEERLKRTNNT